MLCLLGLTVWDVIMRYALNNPSSGVTEWSQMFLIISMTALSNAIVEKRWISVGVVVDKFPKIPNFIIEIVMGAVAFGFFLLVGYQLLMLSQLSIQLHELYFVIKTPRWPMYLFLSVSFLACCLATIVYVIERLQNYSPPKDKAEDALDNPELAFLTKGDEKKEGGAA